MIYITNGITNKMMEEVETDGIRGDFNFLRDYEPQVYPVKWRDKTEILNGNPESKAKVKGKYFIPGIMKQENNKYIRNNLNVLQRSLIVIDIDDISLSYSELFYHINEKLEGFSFITYTTVSNTLDKTKARLIVEPDRLMDETEYKATVEEISKKIDIKIDNVSKTISQHMGLPCRFKGMEDLFQRHEMIGDPYPVITPGTPGAQEKESEDKKPSFEMPQMVPEGERNIIMHKLASSLHAKGLDDQSIKSVMESENQLKFSPPLEEKELDSILNSVLKSYEKGKFSYSSYLNHVTDDFDDLDQGEIPKFFLVPRNKLNPESGMKVDVSLLAMYMKKIYDIKIYKNQFRVKKNNYYHHVENMKALISSEIPEMYRVPSNIRDCEELLTMDKELILKDEDLADEKYISFKNGVLNVERMSFKSHEEKVTHQLIFINQVGCDWNPEAEKDNIADIFFNSATDGNQEDIKYLYEILGVLISGYRSFKNIFYFTGLKDTGKSRYLALAERILTNPDGTKDVSNIGLKVLTDETSKEFSRIIGKRANIAAETPNMKITNDTLLKQLSGGDTVNAQIKFKESVDFKNKAMLIFSGNAVPQFFISDKSSIGERLLIYEFKNKIPKESQIKEIEQQMDLEYVVKKAIQELKKFVENNQEFHPPYETDIHREEMLQDSDSIYKFYQNSIIDTDDHKDRISNSDLYDEYLIFMIAEGHLKRSWNGQPDLSKFKITQYVFTSEIKRYHGRHRFKRTVSYKNIKADCFVGMKVNKGFKGTKEYEEDFVPTTQDEDNIIKGMFGNSAL